MANFKEVSAFLTDKEKHNLRKDVKKRIVRTYNKLPSDEEFKMAVLAGLQKRGWYKRADEAIRRLFSKKYNLFAGILSATSPQQTVEKNINMALRIYTELERSGDIEKAVSLADMESRKHNVRRAIKHEELSGEKVKNFYKNLTGDLSGITLDTWMLKFAGLDNTGVKAKYIHLAYYAKIRKIASEMYLEPAEVQETVWCYAYSKDRNIPLVAVPEFGQFLSEATLA